MNPESLYVLQLEEVLIYLIACILITYAVMTRRKDLAYWLSAYYFITIGITINFFNHNYLNISLLYLITNIFYFLSCFGILLSSIMDYRKYYQKKTFQIFNLFQIGLVGTSILIFTLKSAMIIVLFISLALMLKVFLKTKTAIHALISISIFCALLIIINLLFGTIGFNSVHEFSTGVTIFLGAILLVAAIVGILEDMLYQSEKKLLVSYNRAEFYKDLFSHDINNILQNVLSSIELINLALNEKNYETIGKLTETVKEQISRGANLTKNVQHLSRIEKMNLATEERDVTPFLKEAIERVRKDYPNRNLLIYNDSLKKAEFIGPFDELLMELFSNVLRNAIVYNNNENVEIWVNIDEYLEHGKKYVKIQISDNGIGMEDIMKKKIFKNYEYSEENYSRRGLGLSLVKKIIDLYQGQIWVEDRISEKPNQGSKFIILLPLAR